MLCIQDIIDNKLKIVLLFGPGIEPLGIASGLIKNQNNDFEIVGIVSYAPAFSPPCLKGETKRGSKIKTLIKSKGIWSAIFYLLIKRWFVSPNSFIKKIR